MADELREAIKELRDAEWRSGMHRTTRHTEAAQEAAARVEALIAALATAPAPSEPAPVDLSDEQSPHINWLTNGAAIHPLTANLVVRFARALAGKLAAAEQKYGYTDGWRDAGWMDECRQKLMEHVAKGDPRDVAAYCAFLWHHGEPTARQATETQRAEGNHE